MLHPSPLVALPPFATVPSSSLFISAAEPVVVALTVLEMGWGGSSDSGMPSWSFGIRPNVDACPESSARLPLETWEGSAWRALRTMY
jgi:hypothetical protein